MPSAEWHAKERYRLAMQQKRYDQAIRWKHRGIEWEKEFRTIHNKEEHCRQEDEEQRLSNGWIVLFVMMDIERRKTIGMLLDANWSNSNFWFEKHVKKEGKYGSPNSFYVEMTYYDETGVQIDPKTRQPI